jgi:hypothetical protein
VEHRPPLLDAAQANSRLGRGDLGRRRRASGAPGLRLAARAFFSRSRDKTSGLQGRLPCGFPFGIGRHGAGLVDPVASGGELRQGEGVLCLLIVVPELHQQLARAHPVTLLDRQHFDAAPANRRQSGSLTGFDRPRTGIRNRRFDQPAFDRLQHDGDRRRPGRPPDTGGKQQKEQQRNQETAEQGRQHGSAQD